MVDHNQILMNREQDLTDVQLISNLFDYLGCLQNAFDNQIWKLRQLIRTVMLCLQIKQSTEKVSVIAVL